MLIFLYLCCLSLWAEEPFLHNIRQITFSEMGFEKAGEAYFSPDGEDIIFQAQPKGQSGYQIYTMNLQEGIPHLVSTGKGTCTCSYFRCDGQKILFASSHTSPLTEETQKPSGRYKWELTPYMNIYEANPDGSDLRALTTGPAYHAECAYSPDGTKVVFASNETGSMHIYTMQRDGSCLKRLTKAEGCYHGGPFYSPDGTKIIFRADREEKDLLQLYVTDEEGREEQLTHNKSVNWAPYWHPNGKVIAYTTSLHGHHRYEIYLLNIETKEECRLTDSPSFDGLPVFDPTGTKLLWTSQRGGGPCQIFLADFLMPPNLR